MKYNNFEMAISPASSGEAYYSYVMSLPVLTKEEEKELAQDLLDNNNLDSAKKLIVGYQTHRASARAAPIVHPPARLLAANPVNLDSKQNLVSFFRSFWSIWSSRGLCWS